MTTAERLAEIGALLATAVRRLRANRQRELADGAERERPCDSVDEAEHQQEVA